MPSIRRDFHKPKQKHSETMAEAMDIAPNEGMPALAPLPPVAPVVDAPGVIFFFLLSLLCDKVDK